MQFTERQRRALRVAWCVVAVGVIVGSLLPATSLPIRALSHFYISDKVQHFLAYATLAFLPALHEKPTTVLWAAVGAVLLGVALEFGQLLAVSRSFEIRDMFADALGVCAGLVVALPLRS